MPLTFSVCSQSFDFCLFSCSFLGSQSLRLGLQSRSFQGRILFCRVPGLKLLHLNGALSQVAHRSAEPLHVANGFGQRECAMVVRPQLSGSTCGLLIDQMLQGFGLRLGQWPDDVRVGFAECRYLRLLGLNQTVGGIQVGRQPLGQGIGVLNGRGLNHLMLYEVRQTVETDLLLQLYLPDPALDCLWQIHMGLFQFRLVQLPSQIGKIGRQCTVLLC
ncbi:hypothetical protein D3C81_972580 [compost metagenome]